MYGVSSIKAVFKFDTAGFYVFYMTKCVKIKGYLDSMYKHLNVSLILTEK